METNGMVQLDSLFCKEKRSKKQNPATTFHFYHPMVNKCSEEMYLTNIYIIFHDSRPKKVLFINQSSGTFFCHFLLGLEYLQVQSQASLLHHIVRTGTRMRPPQTQKLRLMLHSVQVNMFINLSLRKR